MANDILFYIVVFISNSIQTITGFAGTMLAMPLSIYLIGQKDARFILNTIAIIVSLWIVYKHKKNINLQVLKEILIFMGVGLLVGIYMKNHVDFQALLIGYGIVIILCALFNLSGRRLNLNNLSLKVILILAGIIHGLFISGGALLVIYATERLKEKVEFRSTLSCVWVILNIILLIELLLIGSINKSSVSLMLIACLPAIIGIFAGQKLQEKINQKTFSIITNILLIISGISIII